MANQEFTASIISNYANNMEWVPVYQDSTSSGIIDEASQTIRSEDGSTIQPEA